MKWRTVMLNCKRLLLLFLYISVVACSDNLSPNNKINKKLYIQEYKDINLYSDLSKNAPYEVNDYFRLAMINMTKYFNKDHHLKRIDVSFDGQYTKGLSQYNFKKNQLDFVKKVKFHEGKKRVLKYIFNNGKLVDCTERGNISHNCKNEETKILHDVKIYKNYENEHN